jgi:hypothetical protein
MFTENQSRQLYVVKNVTSTVGAAGDIYLKNSAVEPEFCFLYKGPSDDGLQRSDLIKKCNIMDVRATVAADMVHKKKKVEVTLDSNVSSTAVLGQDYVLNIIVHGYIANGYDSLNVKFGAARATSTDASTLYKRIAMSVAKNFSREAVKLIKVTLKGDSNNTEITNKTKLTDLSSITATGIILEEVEQPWRLGAAKQEFVNFEVQPSTIFIDEMDQIWGTAEDVTENNSNTIPNSKIIADMEYFFHKNRGDVYGMQGWPDNIDTTYLVNPANADGYGTIDIHYFYEGNSHNIGHSEKTITLVFSDGAKLKSMVTALEGILEDYNVTVNKSKSYSSDDTSDDTSTHP